jgi:hypothetical protein
MKKINFNDIEQKMKSDARSISNTISMDVNDNVINNIPQRPINQQNHNTFRLPSFLFKWVLPLGFATSVFVMFSLNYADSVDEKATDETYNIQHTLAQHKSNQLEHQALKQDIQYLSQIFIL